MLMYMYCYFRYYNPGEIRDFEGNECEWPIFYTYMIIDGVFKNNTEQIEEYQAELRKCMYADECGGTFQLIDNYFRPKQSNTNTHL